MNWCGIRWDDGVLDHVFPVCLLAACPIKYIRGHLTAPPSSSSVTLARGRRVDCPVSFWTHWLKPLTSNVRFCFCRASLSASPFICLFQTPLLFPFLLPLCIPWTLLFCFAFCVVIQNVTAFSVFSFNSLDSSINFPDFLLCLMFFVVKNKISSCLSASPCHYHPLCLSFSAINVALFPLALNEWCFCGRVWWTFAGPEGWSVTAAGWFIQRHCLHVTPGPSTFPSCCSSRVSVPKFLLQNSLIPLFQFSFFYAVIPFFHNMIHEAGFPCSELT